MFIKKISSGPSRDSRPPSEFPKGTRYIRDERMWIVIEEIRDTDAEWRRVRSTVGDEELVTMKTLKEDLNKNEIIFLDNENLHQ